MLLPLLLLLPLAAVSEGFSNAMQVLMQLPGSDAMRIVAAGVPAGVVLAVTILLCAAGLVSFCLLLPLLGLAPTDSFRRKLAVLAGGMIPYWLLIVPLIAIFDPDNMSRGVVLLVFSLLVALAVAALYRPLAARLPADWLASVPAPANWRALWVAGGLGGAALILLLVAWN